jgi:phosphoenolpyruvate-protein kinase (PTS system EI component)
MHAKTDRAATTPAYVRDFSRIDNTDVALDCHRDGIHSGICGRAPSDSPDLAEFLVEIGIDSMSLNPDSILRTTRSVLEVEERLGRTRPPTDTPTTDTN